MCHLTVHEQVLIHQVSDEHLPDVNLIGEMGDVTELGKLVQLVLGCAVSCEKKQGRVCCKRKNVTKLMQPSMKARRINAKSNHMAPALYQSV